MRKKSPVVGIPTCTRGIEGYPFALVGEKYIAAVVDGAGCLPLLIPSLPCPLPIDTVLDAVDGLLITGSPSNVHPRHYQGEDPRAGTLLDEQRDQTTLPLVLQAIRRGVPVIAICRGFQELNVTLGGTLHQHLEEIPGRMDHRAPEDRPIPVKYGPAHAVNAVPDGMLAGITGQERFMVNSVHGQGIDRLASELTVEARADDGTIEAVSVTRARAFALGVQWHPEWQVTQNPISMKIFKAFGSAVQAAAQALPRQEEEHVIA